MAASKEIDVALTFDAIAHAFSATRSHVWHDVAEKLNDYNGPRRMALDLGCGNGRHITFLHSMGFEAIVGVDLSHHMVQTACSNAKLPGVELMIAHASTLPLHSGVFDLVVAVAVLHHITTKVGRIAALKEVRRVLREGGRAIITVWYHPELHGQGDTYVPWRGDGGRVIARRYYYMYSPEELNADLEEAGIAEARVDVRGQNIFCMF